MTKVIRRQKPKENDAQSHVSRNDGFCGELIYYKRRKHSATGLVTEIFSGRRDASWNVRKMTTT